MPNVPGYRTPSQRTAATASNNASVLADMTVVRVKDDQIHDSKTNTFKTSKKIRVGQLFAVAVTAKAGSTIKQAAGNQRHTMTFDYDSYLLVGDGAQYWDYRRFEIVDKRTLSASQVAEVLSRFKTSVINR